MVNEWKNKLNGLYFLVYVSCLCVFLIEINLIESCSF